MGACSDYFSPAQPSRLMTGDSSVPSHISIEEVRIGISVDSGMLENVYFIYYNIYNLYYNTWFIHLHVYNKPIILTYWSWITKKKNAVKLICCRFCT